MLAPPDEVEPRGQLIHADADSPNDQPDNTTLESEYHVNIDPAANERPFGDVEPLNLVV